MESHREQTKRVTFLTYAVRGTLGDVSAVAKLVDALKKKHGEELDIMIVVITDNIYDRQVYSLFSNPESVLLTGSLMADCPPRERRLQESNAVVLFPTTHISSEELETLEKAASHARFFCATEYNFDYQRNEAAKKQSNTRSIDMNAMVAFETGFGKLGIFIESEALAECSQAVAEKEESKDEKFFQLLLGEAVDVNSYQASHELYFGYFNKLPYEAKESKINPAEFARICVAMSNGGNVDIVIPIQETRGENITLPDGKIVLDVINELLKIGNSKQYNIEFHEKDSSGEFRVTKIKGDSDKIIRVINPFPLSPESMRKMFLISQPVVYVTGDQSLSEALSSEKIFIYQTMDWKTKLAIEMREAAKEALGVGALLPQLLGMQFSEDKIDIGQVSEFIKKNKAELQEEVKRFKAYIVAKQNLYENLPDQIYQRIMDDKLYLESVLSQPKISMRMLLKLGVKFPNEQNAMVATLKKRFEDEQVAMDFITDAIDIMNNNNRKKISEWLELLALPENFVDSFINNLLKPEQNASLEKIIISMQKLMLLMPAMENKILSFVPKININQLDFEKALAHIIQTELKPDNIDNYRSILSACKKPEQINVSAVVKEIPRNVLSSFMVNYMKLFPESLEHIVRETVASLTNKEGELNNMLSSLLSAYRTQAAPKDAQYYIALYTQLIDQDLLPSGQRVSLAENLFRAEQSAVVKNPQQDELLTLLLTHNVKDQEKNSLDRIQAIKAFLLKKNVATFSLSYSRNGYLFVSPNRNPAKEPYTEQYNIDDVSQEWRKVFKGTRLENVTFPKSVPYGKTCEVSLQDKDKDISAQDKDKDISAQDKDKDISADQLMQIFESKQTRGNTHKTPLASGSMFNSGDATNTQQTTPDDLTFKKYE